MINLLEMIREGKKRTIKERERLVVANCQYNTSSTRFTITQFIAPVKIAAFFLYLDPTDWLDKIRVLMSSKIGLLLITHSFMYFFNTRNRCH